MALTAVAYAQGPRPELFISRAPSGVLAIWPAAYLQGEIAGRNMWIVWTGGNDRLFKRCRKNQLRARLRLSEHSGGLVALHLQGEGNIARRGILNDERRAALLTET